MNELGQQKELDKWLYWPEGLKLQEIQALCFQYKDCYLRLKRMLARQWRDYPAERPETKRQLQELKTDYLIGVEGISSLKERLVNKKK